MVKVYGWHRTPKGFVVIAAQIQGDRVLSTEVLNDKALPLSQMEAEDLLRLSMAKGLFMPEDERAVRD